MKRISAKEEEGLKGKVAFFFEKSLAAYDEPEATFINKFAFTRAHLLLIMDCDSVALKYEIADM